ncbi:DNA-directed RNA polymerase III subunit Rpc5 [Babesia duncani]|uniref:DNA-directed RNA polymerase III subunit Rpc5 n=1 Tax=Babesia duncani TaxID=323732 RepID=A0AAD9PLJ4_9APIC|nr:DNA-directed RNA polymerase III subunit Rpc5 [Babesia duncani]
MVTCPMDTDLDDPVVSEFDVFVINPTLADIIGELSDSVSSLNVVKELCKNPFEGLLLMQYPLEVANVGDGYKNNSNATDHLDLKSVHVGVNVKRRNNNHHVKFGTPSIFKDTRRKECPYFKFIYDLNNSYPTHKIATSKKQSKNLNAYYRHQKGDFNTLDLLLQGINSFDNSLVQDEVKYLELNSSIVTSEYAMDCLGILNVVETPNGLQRSLHLAGVKGILQLRPKIRSELEQTQPADEELTNLFKVENIQWKQLDKVSFSNSVESNEILQQLIKQNDCNVTYLSFNNDRYLYANAMCHREQPEVNSKDQMCLLDDLCDYKLPGNHSSVGFRDRHHKWIPSRKLMETLDIKIQLQLLLSQRYIDTFSSLKKDLISTSVLCPNKLVDILRQFAHNIDGNWILSSEYAIANYTEEDRFNSDERDYLIACRDLMLALLNRQTCHPTTMRTNTSVGHLASEPFQNATGLPLAIITEFLSAIAKPQGKFWSLKLERDEEFCTKFPKIVSASQKFWASRLVEAANVIQKYKNNKTFTVAQMVENIELKAQIVSFLQYRVCSDAKIKQHLQELGYNNTENNIQTLLEQVAIKIHRSNKTYWVLRQDNVALYSYKMAIINDSDDVKLNDIKMKFQAHKVPEFVFRRINNINLYTMPQW